MVNDVMMGIQSGQLREVSELRWDGAIEEIRRELPDSKNDGEKHKTIE